MEKYSITSAVKKLRRLKKRVRVIPGGTSAGKTIAILILMIDHAAKNPYSEISVVSESIPHLRRGALRDFEKIMKVTGRWREERFNRTLLKYTFGNGSYIEFFSATEENARGPRRHILYMNEVTAIKFEIYFQLSIRTRDFIFLDYNPSQEFWVHTELLKPDIKGNDVDYEVLTYKDNEGLPKSIVDALEFNMQKAFVDPLKSWADEKNIKSKYWANWCRVYLRGELGSLEGSVFPEFEIIKELPAEASLVAHGIDFGATDQNAGVSRYKWNEGFVYDEFLYQNNMLTSEIAKVLKSQKAGTIIGDSAAKQTILDLRNTYGVILSGADKSGSDSIGANLNKMKAQKIYVTERSVNLIKEMRGYTYVDGEYNGTHHLIDAARYTFMGKSFRTTARTYGKPT